MYGETNHHASTIGVNVKIKARFVKFDLAEIVLFFAKSKTRNLFEMGCPSKCKQPFESFAMLEGLWFMQTSFQSVC
jgi:hypothetical protein